MLRPRIIPCLLIHKKGLVKTAAFKNPKYVGDPLNAVKIFNEKEVDELIVLDIDASVQNKEPNFNLIQNLAVECRMPFCYGGGVKTVEHAKKLVSIGVEKVAISSAAVNNPNIISEMAKAIGTQSVVVVIDVKYRGIFKKPEVVIHNATIPTSLKPLEFAKLCEENGAGEIVINSVDRDGMRLGYDKKLLNEIRDQTNIPLTILGGAGSFTDVSDIIKDFGVIGAAAGSLFVFKGKYNAVLISYPNEDEKRTLIRSHDMFLDF